MQVNRVAALEDEVVRAPKRNVNNLTEIKERVEDEQKSVNRNGRLEI